MAIAIDRITNMFLEIDGDNYQTCLPEIQMVQAMLESEKNIQISDFSEENCSGLVWDDLKQQFVLVSRYGKRLYFKPIDISKFESDRCLDIYVTLVPLGQNLFPLRNFFDENPNGERSIGGSYWVKSPWPLPSVKNHRHGNMEYSGIGDSKKELLEWICWSGALVLKSTKIYANVRYLSETGILFNTKQFGYLLRERARL